MKIENLEVGMAIKNYRELCRILGVESKTGRARQNQIEWFEKHFAYHKEGHKFIIDRIISTDIEPMADARGTNPNSHQNQNGAYGKYIRLLVLHMLAQEKDGEVIRGGNKILEELNMINHNFRDGLHNRRKLENYLGIDIKFIDEFFDTNTRKMRDAVETTLNSLEKKERLIYWTKVKMLDRDSDHRKATNEEIKFIIECERKTLKEMGTDDMTHVYASKRTNEFYRKVKLKLAEWNILYAYDAYEIIFSDEVYEKSEQLNYKLGIDEQRLNETELNCTISNNLRKSVTYRHAKVTDEIDSEFELTSDYRATVFDNEFILANERLVNVCIDEGYQDIRKEMHERWGKRQR